MKPTFTLALAAVAAAVATQALAHAQLVAAEPRVGSTVAAAPAQLRLRFNEVPRLAGSAVMLTPPNGKAVRLTLQKDPADARSVLAPAPAGLGAGRYEVKWGVLSPDGHRTQGQFTFTVARK